jgi:hypothetical protein
VLLVCLFFKDKHIESPKKKKTFVGVHFYEHKEKARAPRASTGTKTPALGSAILLFGE